MFMYFTDAFLDKLEEYTDFRDPDRLDVADDAEGKKYLAVVGTRGISQDEYLEGGDTHEEVIGNAEYRIKKLEEYGSSATLRFLWDVEKDVEIEAEMSPHTITISG